jgi:hypothetical protein
VRGAWFSNPANRPTKRAADDDDAEHEHEEEVTEGAPTGAAAEPVGKHLAKALAAAGSSSGGGGSGGNKAVLGSVLSPTGAAAAAAPAELANDTDDAAYAEHKKRKVSGRAELSDFSAW